MRQSLLLSPQTIPTPSMPIQQVPIDAIRVACSGRSTPLPGPIHQTRRKRITHINEIRADCIGLIRKSEESSCVFRLFRRSFHCHFMCFLYDFSDLLANRCMMVAYESAGQHSLSALTTAANPCRAASDNKAFLSAMFLTRLGTWDLYITAPSLAIKRNHSRAA